MPQRAEGQDTGHHHGAAPSMDDETHGGAGTDAP